MTKLKDDTDGHENDDDEHNGTDIDARWRQWHKEKHKGLATKRGERHLGATHRRK